MTNKLIVLKSYTQVKLAQYQGSKGHNATSDGALKKVWRNQYLNIHSKYLLFCMIPLILLLWDVRTGLYDRTYFED